MQPTGSTHSRTTSTWHTLATSAIIRVATAKDARNRFCKRASIVPSKEMQIESVGIIGNFSTLAARQSSRTKRPHNQPYSKSTSRALQPAQTY